jgi:hypothetical protein
MLCNIMVFPRLVDNRRDGCAGENFIMVNIISAIVILTCVCHWIDKAEIEVSSDVYSLEGTFGGYGIGLCFSPKTLSVDSTIHHSQQHIEKEKQMEDVHHKKYQ